MDRLGYITVTDGGLGKNVEGRQFQRLALDRLCHSGLKRIALELEESLEYTRASNPLPL